jgi:epoxyqueuosine reductase QueG
MQTEISSSIVKEYGMAAGASVVGIAPSADFGFAQDGFKPTDVLECCHSVIVLGTAFPREALSLDPPEYTEIRNAMIAKMTEMAKKVAKQVKAAGYKAKDISATGGKWVESGGKKEHFGHISLKHAAELAGIGVISRNYLLTSPEYGNLLWLSAVLTDADLAPDAKIQANFCDNCNKCVEICPSGALDNPALFERNECAKSFVIENKTLVIKCFRCRSVCPHRFGIPENEAQPRI